jgi:hypothetical protein
MKETGRTDESGKLWAGDSLLPSMNLKVGRHIKNEKQKLIGVGN